MSTKISAADSSSGNTSSNATVSTTTTASGSSSASSASTTTSVASSSSAANSNNGTATPTTNGNSTPARRLRTRNSTGGGNGGSGGGGESAKKNSGGGGPLTERNSYASDTNGNGATASGNATSTSTSGDEKPTSSSSTISGTTGSGVGGGGGGGTGGGCGATSVGGSLKKYHNSCPFPTSSGRKAATHTQPHSSSTFNVNKNEEFHFDTPKECPVFRPTPEEFKNPLAYISKIRPIAEKCGIAKILPPDAWSPPFAVDVDKLKFTPRVQRLNELEAKTRVKLNFLDQIAKFWELQGSSLKIPMVERKALDLYTLHRIVQEEGGMEQTTKDRKWAKVANRMSYPSSKSVGATLKAHYERILHPFEVYTSGKVLGGGGAATPASPATPPVEVKLEILAPSTEYKVHEIPTRQQIAPPNENNARRSKRFANSSANCGLGGAARGGGGGGGGGGCGGGGGGGGSGGGVNIKSESKEDCKRDLLKSFGSTTAAAAGAAGSGAAGGGTPASAGVAQKKAPDPQLLDPLMKYICHICNRGDVEESMLLCDGCDDSYHTFCLLPPLSSIPKGEWLCPRCVVEEVSKPTEAFGFEQAEREYTLQQFGQMADQFKMDYFRKPVHVVPTELVEREFWRIVSSIDEDVTVEYGADLHTMDHGSGFPTKSSLYLLPGDQEYAESSWNLNNLPLLEDSILGHINADISGMNAPWMYVGMCFAAFCWHNEDHWSYSINYLHWGEPKTWYGVPGACAEQFEETMKQAAPELFASQPDLLHQLVTIMNPNILMNNGVPVYRTDQNAGEFVITFPRAYHAGFNQGYNFAEAVNFAPADWLKMGRECVNHYSMLRRFCVFSHDELVCKMALEPAKLTFGIATACYIDMAEMVDSEKKLRKSLLEWGVTRAERKAFELVPDDERHCHECNTTCFLSAVACECTKSIVCLRHYSVLCTCPPDRHTLLYRYTLDEMPLMLQKLKAKAQSFERWLSRCRDIVDASTPTSVTLSELQELCKEAELKKFPSSLLIDRLNAAVVEAEKCVTVIQQLGINKVRTRSDNNLEAAQYKLTMDELVLFVQEIDNLCCIIEEGTSVRELLVLGKQFEERASSALLSSLDALEEPELDALISEGGALRIELKQMPLLGQRLKQLKWYKRAQGMRNGTAKLTYADIKNLLNAAAADVAPNDPLIAEEIHRLQEIGAAIEAWEAQAAKYLRTSSAQHELAEIGEFLLTASAIEGQVPSHATLKDALRRARDWLRSVEELQANDHFPYCHTLEAIVERGQHIPLQLEELTRMQGHLSSAHAWKESTARAFLKRHTYYTLLEVLMPRAQPVIIDSDLKQPFRDDFVREMNPAQIVDSFKAAEEQELRDMRELRCQNVAKHPLRDDYCLCKARFAGVMYNCQLCRDWFHDDCVPPPPMTTYATSLNGLDQCGGGGGGGGVGGGGGFPNNNNNSNKSKWLCPSCVRSKRPRLETILPLLVSLQRLPIRLPEDEALRCLAERAMNWQDRARKALSSPDVTAAVEAIANFQRKLKRQRQIGGGGGVVGGAFSSGLHAVTPRKQRHSSSHSSGHHISNNNNNNSSSNAALEDDDDDDDDEGRLHIVEDGFSNDEHDEETEPAGELQKLLSHSETEQLAELMMEGDLLEVSLDESLELWRILITVQAPTSSVAEASALVEQHVQQHQHQLLTMRHHGRQQPPSSVNSGAEDSNDSLLVQSSPNSNMSGMSLSGRHSSGGGGGGGGGSIGGSSKKRRSLDPNNACPVPRKKNATPCKQPNSGATTPASGAGKKSTRKSDHGRQPAAAADAENAENYTPSKATSAATSTAAAATTATTNGGGGAASHNAQKKRKRIGGGVSPAAGATAGGNATAATNATSASSGAGGGGGGGGGGSMGQKKHSQRAQMAQQEDDEEECRAENCHKPTGREVDWVQCDGGCNEWFHMYCVGLNRSQIKADDDYICIRCSKTVAVAAASITSGGAISIAAATATTTLLSSASAMGAINNNINNANNNNSLTGAGATTATATLPLGKSGRSQAAR